MTYIVVALVRPQTELAMLYQLQQLLVEAMDKRFAFGHQRLQNETQALLHLAQLYVVLVIREARIVDQHGNSESQHVVR